MKPNINQLLKQAQKMQENLAKVQEELANITVDGTSGGGMVKVVANCQNQIVEVKVDPEVINPDDKDIFLRHGHFNPASTFGNYPGAMQNTVTVFTVDNKIHPRAAVKLIDNHTFGTINNKSASIRHIR